MPLTGLAALSKRVFNAEHRLSLAAELGQQMGKEELWDQSQIIDALRGTVPRSCAQKEVQFLVSIGALDRLEANRQVFFRMRDHSFWSFARELTDSIADVEAGSSTIG